MLTEQEQLYLTQLKLLGIHEQIALGEIIPKLLPHDLSPADLETMIASSEHFLVNGSLHSYKTLSQSDFEEAAREGRVAYVEKLIEQERDYKKALQRLQLNHLAWRDLFGKIEIRARGIEIYYLKGKVNI